MYLRHLFIVVLSVFVTCPAFGAEFIYKSKNKIDFIKLDKAKKQEKEGGVKHPYDFNPEQMRAILSSVHFNKKILMLKDIENRQLFDEDNVEFLVPYLVDAFKKVKADQVVVASYFTRKTKVVVQDDRLTIFRAFVKDDGFHIRFTKLYAKMLGDRTTMGAERAANEARSIRVSLEVQPGQNRISWDPEELVFDLAYYRTGGAGVPGSGDGQMGAEAEKRPKHTSRTAKKESVEEEGKSIRVRMKELEQLKKDELITEKEYQRKRKELIEQL